LLGLVVLIPTLPPEVIIILVVVTPSVQKEIPVAEARYKPSDVPTCPKTLLYPFVVPPNPIVEYPP
jgi:hypothetical protein